MGQLRLHAEYYAYRSGGSPGSVGSASSTVRWHDTVTTTSGTLPAGTPVTYMASVRLSGSLAEIIVGNAIGNGIIRAVASGGNAYGSYYLHIEEKENAPGVRVLTDTFTSSVGASFPINGYLYGTVGGDAINGGSSHLTADFLSTAGFTLTCLTDGAAYTTESSTSYIWGPAPGDANGDGAVDLQDFGLLKANFGTTTGAVWAQGDFNDDGAVDLQDFGLLKANFGTAGAGAGIPEPATSLLLTPGALSLIRKKRI